MYKTATNSILAMFIIVLATTSCSKEMDNQPKEIDISDLYDVTQSFEVIDQEQPKDGNGRFEIRVTDPRHGRLLSWLKSNDKNWKPAPNTHAGLVIIYQENFRLLLYRNHHFAVVVITDDNGISNYYKKSLDVGGLEFLDE